MLIQRFLVPTQVTFQVSLFEAVPWMPSYGQDDASQDMAPVSCGKDSRSRNLAESCSQDPRDSNAPELLDPANIE